MFCNADGQPNPNGHYQIINGSLCLRDGHRVSFDLALFDGAPGAPRTFHDAKTEPPKSIDEALQQRFAEMAKGLRISVKELLANLGQAKIEEIAAEEAASFVAAHATKGVAAQFATDAALDAELNYRLSAARAKHESGRRPFTANDAAAVVAKVAAARMASTYQTDSAADAERARSEYRGALAASKHLTANAWRR